MTEAKASRLSTPLVLTAASVMVCIGAVALMSQGDGAEASNSEPPAPSQVLVETGTPEKICETFLDAWRKRDHEIAARFATGDALSAVLARKEQDERLTDDERQLKAQLWDQMASGRLAFRPAESSNLDGGRLRLQGTAEGTFVGSPYSREVAFVLVPEADGHKVEGIDFGEILSDVPSTLRLREGHDDGRLAPRPAVERPGPRDGENEGEREGEARGEGSETEAPPP